MSSVVEADKQPATLGGMSGIARQTVVYGIGMVVGKGLSVILLPVYTRLLSPGDYGVMALIDMVLDVVMIVAGAKLVEGIFRFYNKATSPREANRVVSTAFVGLMFTFAVMGGATFFAAAWLSNQFFNTGAHSTIVRVAALTIAVTPTLLVPQAYFQMQDRARVVVSSNLIKLVVAAALNVILLLRGWGVLAMFASGLISTIVVGSVLTVMMLREVGYGLSPRAFRDLTRYGVPLIATNLATFAFTFGDRYFLQNASSETAVGLYAFAYQFGFILMMVGYGPFTMVWRPRRFRIAQRPDRDELYALGFIYVNVILLSAAAGLIVFIDDFFRLMATPAFYPSAALVPVILVAYILQGWANVQDIGILIRERTEFLTLANWVAAAVALIAYGLLIPRYLAWGAAYATVITFAVRYALIYGISQWLWPVRYQWGPVFRLIGLASVVSVIGRVLPEMPLPISLVVRSAIYALFMWSVWEARILTESDRDALRERGSRAIDAVRQLVPRQT